MVSVGRGLGGECLPLLFVPQLNAGVGGVVVEEEAVTCG